MAVETEPGQSGKQGLAVVEGVSGLNGCPVPSRERDSSERVDKAGRSEGRAEVRSRNCRQREQELLKIAKHNRRMLTGYVTDLVTESTFCVEGGTRFLKLSSRIKMVGSWWPDSSTADPISAIKHRHRERICQLSRGGWRDTDQCSPSVLSL